MSSKRLRAAAAALSALMLLAGCGFKPLYGRGEAGGDPVASATLASRLSAVAIAPYVDRSSQKLANLLIDELHAGGAADVPLWRLDYTLDIRQSALSIRRDDTATRGRVTVRVVYSLIDLGTGEKLFTATSRSINSYNILDAQYAALVTAEDARDRGIQEVAQEMRQRVALTLAGASPEAAP